MDIEVRIPSPDYPTPEARHEARQPLSRPSMVRIDCDDFVRELATETGAHAQVIRAAVREVFGPTATIRLFGSRVRNDLRGGDIDLLVEVEPGQASIANEQRLRDQIAPAVEDLRVDIILHERGMAFTPLERIALRDGILL